MPEETKITEGCRTAAGIIVGGVISALRETGFTEKGMQSDEAQSLLRQSERIISEYTSPEYERKMRELKETLKRLSECQGHS